MAIYPVCVLTASSATQWLITVRLTSRPNVSDQLTLLPVHTQMTQVDKDQFLIIDSVVLTVKYVPIMRCS